MENFGLFLREKCMEFSIDVVNLYKYLCETKKEYVISKQLLRSGTSIGANLIEAQNGISSKDFLAKLYISLKEAAETEYWLELLYRTNYINEEEFIRFDNKCKELCKLFNSITKNTKK